MQRCRPNLRRAKALKHHILLSFPLAANFHPLETPLQDLSRQKAAYRNALREQLRRGEEKRYAELQANLRRAEALVEEARTTAAAKAALTVAEERKERAGQMDDLRLKVTQRLGLQIFKLRGFCAEKSHAADCGGGEAVEVSWLCT
jgi:tRNA(Ile)-lysidine synthase TilS/MesJ